MMNIPLIVISAVAYALLFTYTYVRVSRCRSFRSNSETDERLTLVLKYKNAFYAIFNIGGEEIAKVKSISRYRQVLKESEKLVFIQISTGAQISKAALLATLKRRNSRQPSKKAVEA